MVARVRAEQHPTPGPDRRNLILAGIAGLIVFVHWGLVGFDPEPYGTAPIEVVDIISGGQCVWQGKPDAWDVELDGVGLPAPEGDSAYYYLRLRQADGHRAWLSPVWLDATK